MNTELHKLLTKLQTSFMGEPWFGDSVMGKLTKIDVSAVNNTPTGTSNSIARITQHIINWRIFCIEKVKGNEAFDIEMNSEIDWPTLEIKSGEEWINLLNQLIATQSMLMEVLGSKEDEFLDSKVLGREYDQRNLIEGIIQHDIYHLGQIAILEKQLSA